MTEHDRARAVRAASCDRNSLESLAEAICGLQSTDDPSLVPLCNELERRYQELKQASDSAKAEE